MKRLGVNIDHVATVRNARGEFHPDPYKAALFVKKKGADSITIHLREDRRHISDLDAKRICSIKKHNHGVEIQQEGNTTDSNETVNYRSNDRIEGGTGEKKERDDDKREESSASNTNCVVSLIITLSMHPLVLYI